jgi:3-hydroxy-9,10-secoandrosta-1,3,5(10)-triene-9,17-dione monooxygenase
MGAYNGAMLYLNHFSMRCQDDVFYKNSDPIIILLGNPCGNAKKVDGGYELSGHWRWASGCAHASWMILNGKIEGDTSSKEISFVVPINDVRIVDTWHTFGLKGTGSNDVLVEKAFVPEHRITSYYDTMEGNINENVSDIMDWRIHLAFAPTISLIFSAAAIGAARNLLREFESAMHSRVFAHGEGRQAARSSALIVLGESYAEIEAAEQMVIQNADALMTLAESKKAPELSERIVLKVRCALAVDVASRAVDRIFGASGSGVILDSARAQMSFRDFHSVRVHPLLNMQVAAEVFGRVRMGLPPGNNAI